MRNLNNVMDIQKIELYLVACYLEEMSYNTAYEAIQLPKLHSKPMYIKNIKLVSSYSYRLRGLRYGLCSTAGYGP